MPKRKRGTHQNHSSYKNRELTQAEIWDDRMLVRSWEEAVKEYEFYHSLHARGLSSSDVAGLLDEAEEAEREGREVDLRLDEDGGGDVFLEEKGRRRRERLMEGVDDREVGEAEEGEEGEIEEGGFEGERIDGQMGDEEVEDGEIDDEEVNGALAGAKAKLLNGLSTESMETATNSAHGKKNGPRLPPIPNSNSAHQTQSRQEQPAQLHDSQQGQPEASTVQSNAEGAKAAGAEQTLENIKMAYYWAGYYSGLYDGQRQAATDTTSANAIQRDVQ